MKATTKAKKKPTKTTRVSARQKAQDRIGAKVSSGVRMPKSGNAC